MNARTAVGDKTVVYSIDAIHDMLGKCRRHVDIDLVRSYLRTVTLMRGYLDTGDEIYADEKLPTRLEFVLGDISIGDVVYVHNHGFFLVTDTRPAAVSDGKHSRCLRLVVRSGDDGRSVVWTIDCAYRGTILSNDIMMRYARSTFDMKEIERLSYERYVAYNKISAINTQLRKMSFVEMKGDDL